MVAQVLTERSLSAFEETVLTTLMRYSKPVKTKNLAERMKVERSSLVPTLNKLSQLEKITYTCLPNNKDDYRGREDKIYGWVSL